MLRLYRDRSLSSGHETYGAKRISCSEKDLFPPTKMQLRKENNGFVNDNNQEKGIQIKKKGQMDRLRQPSHLETVILLNFT